MQVAQFDGSGGRMLHLLSPHAALQGIGRLTISSKRN
jgi:hypothetical protein